MVRQDAPTRQAPLESDFDPFEPPPMPSPNVMEDPDEFADNEPTAPVVDANFRGAEPKAAEEDVEQSEALETPRQSVPARSASAGQVLLAIVFYSLAASGMLIVNKLCMKEAHLPSFFGILQFAVAALTVVLLSAVGTCPREDVTLRWARVRPYLLYSFIFVAVIYSNMQALLHSSIATVIVFRAAVPLFVSVLDWLFLGRQLPSKRSLLALLCVAGSAIGYVAFDRELKMRGIGAYTVGEPATTA